MPCASRRPAALPAPRGGRIVAAAWLLGGLAGCGGMAPPALPTAVPAHWANAGVAPPDAARPALRDWWKSLADAPLDALVEQALAQNLDIAAAGSRLRQARRLALRGTAAYLPTLSADSRTLQDVQAIDSYLHASLDVTWELGLFGLREGAQQVAKAELDSSEAALQSARVAVVAEVVHHYLALRAAQQQAALLERLLALDGRAIDLAAVRSRARLAEPGDADEALARRSQTAALLPAARQAAVQATQALAVLLGRT